MSQGLRMVHLRTVPDAWQAKVIAARLGSEGILTHLQGSVAGPTPSGLSLCWSKRSKPTWLPPC